MISSSIVVSTGGFTLLSPNRFNNVNSIQLQKHHQHHHQHHHHHQQQQQHNIMNNRYVQYLSMSSKNDEKEEMKQDEDDEEQTPMENQGLSFEDATAALKAEDDADRMAARGAMLEEDSKRFNAKKSEFDDMRNRIRARATDLKIEKSVTTAEAIKAATTRAQGLEDASTPTVDLSKFSSALGGGTGDDEEPEDVLTDEQMKEIDKVGQLSIIEQIKEELNNTKFPSFDATIKQAILMIIIFVVTATIILKADELLRYQITDWGFIPRSGEVVDYSDLSLPEGFTDQMTDTDLESL